MSAVAPDDDSIAALVSRTVADAGEVARAEIELYKSRMLLKVNEAKDVAVFGLAAAAVGHLGLIALVMGLLLILQRAIGPIWATVIVAGVLLVAAAVLGWFALRHLTKLTGKARGV